MERESSRGMIAIPPAGPDPEDRFLGVVADRVSEVLETMFFNQAAPLAEPPPTADGLVCATLEFHGSPSGRFWLWVSASAAPGLAADMLAMEREEVDDVRAGETICELANMLCGSVVSRVEAETLFELSAPRLAEPADSQSVWERMASSRLDFEIEGGALSAAFEVSPEGGAARG